MRKRNKHLQATRCKKFMAITTPKYSPQSRGKVRTLDASRAAVVKTRKEKYKETCSYPMSPEEILRQRIVRNESN